MRRDGFPRRMVGQIPCTKQAEKGETEMKEKIESLLEQIRPILQRDGGDIEFVDVTPENIVQVRLKGHCAGCMGARMTLSNIVQQVLQNEIPEIKGVEAVD